MVTQFINLLTPGHLDLPGHPGGAGALLPGHHDLLGAGLRVALDPRILLLRLDLPRPPSLHGHQVDVILLFNLHFGILNRKLKPHRMLWFVVSTLVHILISVLLLISWTVPHSWPSLDFGGAHQLTYGLCLCLFLSLLLTFEVRFKKKLKINKIYLSF